MCDKLYLKRITHNCLITPIVNMNVETNENFQIFHKFE